jgi:poly(A) polymerase
VTPDIYNDKRFGINQKNISPNALSIISKLHKSGFKAYIVGGGIRDMIKGMSPKDFDIVTDCEPEQIRRIFRNSRIIGRRFKLVHVAFPDEVIETTTFRSGNTNTTESIEVNEKGRIVRDNQWGTQEEDVLRRDLTINSIYYDPFSHEVIDYTDGIKDLKDKKIRFIGKSGERILEDPVRILRAIRFAAKLNFTIDQEIVKGIKEHRHQLLEMPSARLYEEVLKLFLSGHAERSYIQLKAHGVFEILFPHLQDEDNEFDKFFINAFKETDRRLGVGKKLNIGFIYAILLWPKVFIESEINERINFKKFYRAIANVVRKQQLITSVPKKFSSFIKDIWMNQVRFSRVGKKSINFTKNIRFRAAYDFLLLREIMEPELKPTIDWWTEFKTANYDKKIRLLNTHRKKNARKHDS